MLSSCNGVELDWEGVELKAMMSDVEYRPEEVVGDQPHKIPQWLSLPLHPDSPNPCQEQRCIHFSNWSSIRAVACKTFLMSCSMRIWVQQTQMAAMAHNKGYFYNSRYQCLQQDWEHWPDEGEKDQMSHLFCNRSWRLLPPLHFRGQWNGFGQSRYPSNHNGNRTPDDVLSVDCQRVLVFRQLV